jgi:hypothetical protein
MLSQAAGARPNAAAFAGCQWFSEDMLLRCLKFLDSILQRDSGQKVRRAAGGWLYASCTRWLCISLTCCERSLQTYFLVQCCVRTCLSHITAAATAGSALCK